jgi:hypothetical protein
LSAGRAARRIDSTWHGGAEAEQRATEGKLVEFIEKYPTDPKCTGMRLRLAWIRIGQNRIEEARRLVDSVAEVATGVDADWVTTLRGALLRRSGDSEGALASFMTLNGKIVDGSLRDIWAEEAVAAALAAARLDTAAELLVAFRANGSEERLLQTESKIESIVVRLNGDALIRLLEKLSHDVSLPVADESTRQARRLLLELVRSRLAVWVLKEKNATLSRRVLENAPPKFLRSEVGEQLVRLSELALSPVLTLHASVGLLLEMQDDFSSRRSAELMTGALRALDAGSKESPVRLVSREIRTTDPAAIAEGFKSLVSDGAGILIAGITASTTTEALRLARDEGVVVVSLSGHPGPVQPASWFGVVDVNEAASTFEREPLASGLVRVTMDGSRCPFADGSGNVALDGAWRRGLFVLTDEECARKLSFVLRNEGATPNVWLGPEAVGARDEFASATLVTSPKFVVRPSTGPVLRFVERFRRLPYWFEALGHDVVTLSMPALRVVPASGVTGATPIGTMRSQIAVELARAHAELMTSDSTGYDASHRLRPTLVKATALAPVPKEDGE